MPLSVHLKMTQRVQLCFVYFTTIIRKTHHGFGQIQRSDFLLLYSNTGVTEMGFHTGNASRLTSVETDSLGAILLANHPPASPSVEKTKTEVCSLAEMTLPIPVTRVLESSAAPSCCCSLPDLFLLLFEPPHPSPTLGSLSPCGIMGQIRLGCAPLCLLSL